jgi:hypothetical protein
MVFSVPGRGDEAVGGDHLIREGVTPVSQKGHDFLRSSEEYFGIHRRDQSEAQNGFEI